MILFNHVYRFKYFFKKFHRVSIPSFILNQILFQRSNYIRDTCVICIAIKVFKGDAKC